MARHLSLLYSLWQTFCGSYFTLRPLTLVLAGPLTKVRNSYLSSSRCKVKSSTFIWWCSCRPRVSKCLVSSHHMVEVELEEFLLQAGRSARGLLPLLLSNLWIHLAVFLCPTLVVSQPSLPGRFCSYENSLSWMMDFRQAFDFRYLSSDACITFRQSGSLFQALWQCRQGLALGLIVIPNFFCNSTKNC